MQDSGGDVVRERGRSIPGFSGDIDKVGTWAGGAGVTFPAPFPGTDHSAFGSAM